MVQKLFSLRIYIYYIETANNIEFKHAIAEIVFSCKALFIYLFYSAHKQFNILRLLT